MKEKAKLTDEEIFARYKDLAAAYSAALSAPWSWEKKAEVDRLYREKDKFQRGSKRRAQAIEAGYREQHLRYLAEHPVVWPSIGQAP
jgi:hypothetical protein